MASSTHTEPAAMTRRVSFGATPAPCCTPNSRTRSSSPKTVELHRTLYDYAAANSVTDSTLDQFVPTVKVKSMSDLDKKEEARMAKMHKEKAKKGGLGIVDWFRKKIMGGGGKKD